MRQHLLLISALFLLLFTACGTESTSEADEAQQKKDEEAIKKNYLEDVALDFNYKIDEKKIKRFKKRGYDTFDTLVNFSIGNKRHDETYNFVKPHLEFYLVDTIKINDVITAKVIYATPSKELDINGKLNLLYFATFNKYGKQVDVVRLAKYEKATDWLYVETAQIKRNRIIKKITGTDTIDGYEGEIDDQENFYVNNNGKIDKL